MKADTEGRARNFALQSAVADENAPQAPGEIKLSKDALYVLKRESAHPAGGHQVAVNPPALLWPRTAGKSVRYDVHLSQDPTFPEDKTILSVGQPWAMFNPHRMLACGLWYWQYADSGSGALAWSKTNAFLITDTTPIFESPTAGELLAKCPRSHPRLLVHADQLEIFRKRAKESGTASATAKAAKELLGQNLPTEQDAFPKRVGKNEMQSEKLAADSSKALGLRMHDAVSLLSMAYLMTGDEQFGREAIRWGLAVATWDRAGITGLNDLGDQYYMKAMVLAYDSAYGLLSEAEKRQLLQGIRARAGHFFNNWINRLEAKLTHQHTWQHILCNATETAVATLGEMPEAEQWLTYAYEVWLARVPTEGCSDGGWTVGTSYLGVEADSLIGMPSLFEKLTGIDFFGSPFYKNSLYYMMYCLPPRSFSDGFGDSHERGGPRGAHIRYAKTVGAHLCDPYASWYVRKSQEAMPKEKRKRPKKMAGEQSEGGKKWDDAGLGTRRELPPALDPAALPQARAFRETGVVAMHTNLADATQNVFVSLRSSPWGSFGHAQADQNTFNIVADGQRLFYSSGYKVSGRDEHVLGWYKHTRGHNGILIDGQGQPYGTEAYGWIPRFLHGERITYAVGDASRAYESNAGLTRFRRHVLLLRPSTVVVYDELSADHHAEWSWLLHSMEEIRIRPGKQVLFGSAGHVRSRTDILGSVPLKFELTNRFAVPAINWRGITKGGKAKVEYADNQWHLTALPANRTANMRFLAIFQISRAGATGQFTEVEPDRDGWLRTSEWQIRGELDASQRPILEVQSLDGTAALATGKCCIKLGEEEHAATLPGSALLIEKAKGNWTRQEALDELPNAAQA